MPVQPTQSSHNAQYIIESYSRGYWGLGNFLVEGH